MKHIVADTSIVVKWVLPDRDDEGHADKALRILELIRESRVAVHQPPHWLAETSAVIQRLSPETAMADIEDLCAINFDVIEAPEVYLKACELSSELKHHIFDTLYHAVALLMQDTVLVTADRKYFGKAESYGNIALLESAGF
ncbi:MAG: type II toxin-antitoxin system VapC family toxin [Desulfatitalea sp.]|nr:type II toxin-antitoxin system VapC family toxin [Desulfatitalea sp.]NNK02757.1 type II toxin-antitoxin system VapC family toxin [Desulfatitalea sp.]